MLSPTFVSSAEGTMSYTPQWGPGSSPGNRNQASTGSRSRAATARTIPADPDTVARIRLRSGGSGYGSGGSGGYNQGGFDRVVDSTRVASASTGSNPPPNQPFNFGSPSGPPPQPPRRRRFGGLIRFLVLILIIGGIAVAYPTVIRPALAKFGNKAAQDAEDEAKKGAKTAAVGECVVDRNAPGQASAPADSDDVKLRVVPCDGPEAAYKVVGVVNNKLQSEADTDGVCGAYPGR
jgi:hypothetical protein